MRYVLTATEGAGADRIGGKAAPFAVLARGGVRIPPWFVLTPDAFYESLPEDARRALGRGCTTQIERLAGDIRPAAAVLGEVYRALEGICPRDARVAVRSSAIEEDGALHSFAGQFESYLFVGAEDIADKIAAVWRSAFSPRALAYRRERGIAGAPGAPAVLVQKMIDPESTGVAFGADPVTGQRGVAVVGAIYGLGTALVSGAADADLFHVDRDGGVMRRHIARKSTALRFDASAPGCIAAVAIPPDQIARAVLDDTQVVAVAALARQAGRLLGRPQDIEWAIEGSELCLLQSRPITTLAGMADPDGRRILWDNSNIVESYGGITTPLTFSFARKAYTEVYRRFCRIVGVADDVIAANSATFANMLGLIHGRVYYNLMSWYRALALLPGFKANSRFMEQMMGVKEALSDADADSLHSGGNGTAGRILQLLPMAFALICNYVTLDRQIRAFNARLERMLAPPEPPLEELRADELAAYYRTLESEFLARWDAPLVNDLLCMVFFGVLTKLCRGWCNDRNGTLQNDLVRGQAGISSAEPARRLVELARIASRQPGLAGLLREAALTDIVGAIEHSPEFRESYRAYLERFGERCVDELKLESETLHDDPLPLLRAIGACAERLDRAGGQLQSSRGERVETELCVGLLRRPVFSWVLRHARGRIRDRENLRFARTRVFGRVRRVFLELGKRLYADGLLTEARDVFYLEVEELLGFIEGTATTTELARMAAVRKIEYERYRALRAPAARFETRGMVNHAQALDRGDEVPASADVDQLQGLGCCSGVVRGPVRVVRDPRGISLHGEILVAEHTDPGWVTLFPSAAGLLVERGSLLSHSAIIARELALPAVVGLTGITGWLADGDWVELDGATGTVRRVHREAAP